MTGSKLSTQGNTNSEGLLLTHVSQAVILFICCLISCSIFFFIASPIVWGFSFAFPTLASLSPAAFAWAAFGILLLPAAILTFIIVSIVPEFWKELGGFTPILALIFSIVFSIILFITFAAPFFIAIACGAPAIISASFLSWSATNITLLTYPSLLLACAFGYLVASPFLDNKTDNKSNFSREGSNIPLKSDTLSDRDNGNKGFQQLREPERALAFEMVKSSGNKSEDASKPLLVSDGDIGYETRL